MTCDDCVNALKLNDIIEETRHEFESSLYVNCSCGVINKIETNKSHCTSERGPAVFDVNTKAAIGMCLSILKIILILCNQKQILISTVKFMF